MRLKKNAFAAIAVVLALITGAAAQTGPQVTPEQKALCQAIEKSLSTLAQCRVGGGNTKESVSLLVVSLVPVWDDDDAKQGWLESLVEGAGAALNAAPSIKVDDVIILAPALISEKIAYAVPAASLKSLQSRVKDGSLKLEDVTPILVKDFVKKPINSK